METISVLDLCAGKNSVLSALNDLFNIKQWNQTIYNHIHYTIIKLNNKYTILEYIGVDIYSPNVKNLHLDLTQDNILEKLKGELPFNWKPNFIWASPVCNKFSVAATGLGGNSYFIVDKESKSIRPRKILEYSEVKHNGINNKSTEWVNYFNQANKSLKLHNNCLKIIKHYNCNFVIENPSTALSKYLYKDLFNNKCNYCMYGLPYKKSTSLYSNKKYELLKCNNTHTHTHHYTVLKKEITLNYEM